MNACSKLTNGNVFPLRRPSKCTLNARTVLAVKGSLRRAKSRRALAGSAPFRPQSFRDGRLRREHFTVYLAQIILQNLTHTTALPPVREAISFIESMLPGVQMPLCAVWSCRTTALVVGSTNKPLA